jgi:hypothetical protein
MFYMVIVVVVVVVVVVVFRNFVSLLLVSKNAVSENLKSM